MNVTTFHTFSKPKNSPQPPQNGQSQISPTTPYQDSTSNDFSTSRNNILMQTATTSVSNLEKNSVITDVQVINDSGSQRTYVNEVLAKD